jgi:hypothetical protein
VSLGDTLERIRACYGSETRLERKPGGASSVLFKPEAGNSILVFDLDARGRIVHIALSLIEL